MAKKKRGISDTKLALINHLQKEKYRAVPLSERVLFLPHCLRKPKGCHGETTEEGLICKHCQPDCAINHLTTYAAARGYRCFVVPGGEMVFNLVEKHRPKAILGVACNHEMGQAADRIGSKESTVEFAYQGITLSKTGCVDTRVDEEAVKTLLDLAPRPTPVTVERVPEPSALPTARRRAWRIGAFGAAASLAVALAALVLLPPMFGPVLAPHAAEAAPELSYSSYPTARYSKDADGTPTAEVHAAIFNNGPGDARNVVVRATAMYCAKPFMPGDGGLQSAVINDTIPSGGHRDVTLLVRLHSQNDTSIIVETLMRGKVDVVGIIKALKPVFIRNVDVTISATSIMGGRQANLSIQVFNNENPRPSGSLNLVASSFTSKNMHWDSAEAGLQGSFGKEETWSVTMQLDINQADPGRPVFLVELYENGGGSPIDSMTVDG